MARLTPENALLPEDTIEYEASICRESFFDFVLEFWDCVPGAGKLVYNWHIGFMAEEMQKLARRVVAGLPREYDLVVNIPPGTSKSTVISILFPAWVWTIFPQARFISATHTDNLALDLAAKSRTVITSEKYQRLFPFVTLAKDSVEYFTNTSGGDRLTCTVGGKTPMGFHASVILVDDPIDPQGARSEVEISTAEHFITEVIPSRKVDKEVSPIVLVMQRLEYRDPTAVMLRMAESPDVPPVRHICLPGEQSEDVSPPLSEIRKRYPEAYAEDRLLDPKRLSRRVLNEFKVRLRTGFWSQIMQKPTPPGGGMFKLQYFQLRVRSAPYQARRVRSWDRAQTQDGGCYTAGVLMAKDIQGQYYVENVVHGQWDPYERNDIIAAVALRDRVRYGPKFEPMIIIEEETGSTGKESFRRMAAQLEGFRVKSDKPTGSKDVRAEPWSSACAAGLVRIVDNGEKENWGKSDWDINGYILEHTLFKPMPGKRIGGIVDRVDASSAAYNYLAGTKVGEVMKVFTLGETRNKGLRLVVCTRDNLVNTTTEHRTLLVSIQDPIIEEQHGSGSFSSDQGDSGNLSGFGVLEGQGQLRNGVVTQVGNQDEQDTEAVAQMGGGVLATARVPGEPAHSLVRCLGILILRFADLAANELQDEWDKPVSPYNKPPSELVLSRDDAKRLWAFLLKKRDPGAEIVVIQDDGDRRALSLAYAICDVLRQPRSVVHVVGHEEMNHTGKAAPNEHCYEVAKVGRSAVVG